MTAPHTYRDLPGHVIGNPLGCEIPAWWLEVESVSEPDHEGMILIHSKQGTIRCNPDMCWHLLWVSPTEVARHKELGFDEAMLAATCPS